MEACQLRYACDELIALIVFNLYMKKSLMVALIIAIFAAVVYFFETGEKDQMVTPNEAPNHVKG